MADQRPDPDKLLAHLKSQEAQATRGKLKIFFGASAGVGKTNAMLEAARKAAAEGIDVVVGYVEPHGRKETEALLIGLEVLPSRLIDYRGAKLREFDLDAALARKPALILVDELAHTNAPGLRHAKRWQDVEELLSLGIEVYTTVNVQHLESLNDIIAQITGVRVRETVPDAIFETAAEVELVDLPPDDLLLRLKEGKVYVPKQAAAAIENFFRKGNLIALRDLALRRTAERVHAQMQTYRHEHDIVTTWPTAERILVCVGPSPSSARLVRAARRLAHGLRAEWIAVHVETPAHARLPQTDRDRLHQNLRLAESLGAKTLMLSGLRMSEEIVNCARSRNISKIVVGKPTGSRWREALCGSLVGDIVRHSGDIDVYVIRGEPEDETSTLPLVLRSAQSWPAYLFGLLVVALCSGVGKLLSAYLSPPNLIMIYLLGVVFIAARFGRGPALLASLLSVIAFNFFFVPPILTFNVADPEYFITFGVMFVVALIISTLTLRLRHAAEAARRREQRTAELYDMSRELVTAKSLDQVREIVLRHMQEVFASAIALLLPDENGRLTTPAGASFAAEAKEQSVAQWVYDLRQKAGLGTATLPGANALYLPLFASRGIVGVLGVRPQNAGNMQNPELLQLLETFANQIALAVESARLSEEAQRTQIMIETEKLRNTLLSSVSHDLRTPLASITGAASSLLEPENALPAATRRELTQTIHDEAARLNRLVRNLLDMTRLESGAVKLNKEWQPLEEVIGAALTRLDEQLTGRQVTTHLPPDLPFVAFDGVLLEQVFINLLENAIKYTPAASPIAISARIINENIVVEIADCGPGLPPTEIERVFGKFYRSRVAEGKGGVGLGLTICKSIIEAHGGRIWAENRPEGGAAFRFTLPLKG